MSSVILTCSGIIQAPFFHAALRIWAFLILPILFSPTDTCSTCLLVRPPSRCATKHCCLSKCSITLFIALQLSFRRLQRVVAADSNAAQSLMVLRRETLEEVLVRKTPRKHPEPEHRPGPEHERNEKGFDERRMVCNDQHTTASHVVHCAPVAADSDDTEQSEQPEGDSEKSSEQHRHGEAAQERRESPFSLLVTREQLLRAAHLAIGCRERKNRADRSCRAHAELCGTSNQGLTGWARAGGCG